MLRVFFILVVIALLVWVAEFYYSSHSGGQPFWDSLSGSPAESTPAPGKASAPESSKSTASNSSSTSPSSSAVSPSETPEHTVATCRAALQKQTQTLLLPLDQNKDFSPDETMHELQATQRDLVQYRRDPDYQHLVQACGVLAQLMQERQNYLQRYVRDSASPTPSESSLQLAGLQPSRDIKPLTPDRATFFKDRVVAEWHERCAYYQPILNGLLRATN